MTLVVTIRLGDAGDAFLSLHHSLSPLPSSFLIFERYNRTTPASDSPQPRFRRWARRSSTPTQVKWLTSPGQKGLRDAIKECSPSDVFVLASATPGIALDESALKDVNDVLHAVRGTKYNITLLLDGTLPEKECSELKKAFHAAKLFQGVTALQIFAAHLRAAARPGLAADMHLEAPVWTGPIAFSSGQHPKPDFELTSRDVALPQHSLDSLQGAKGVVKEVAPRVPETGAILAACGTLELRLGTGCDEEAAKFVEQWINSGKALLLEVSSLQFWCFWTRTREQWCCRALHVPELPNALVEALDVARFRRQDLGFECTEQRLVPEVLGRLPEIRVHKLLERDTLEDIKHRDAGGREARSAEALALLQEETRICGSATIPVHGKKRITTDEDTASQDMEKPGIVASIEESPKDGIASEIQVPTCKFSEMPFPLSQPAEPMKKSKSDVMGSPVEKVKPKPVDSCNGSVLSASILTGNTASPVGNCQGDQRTLKKMRFDRLKSSALVRPVKRTTSTTSAPVQRKRLRPRSMGTRESSKNNRTHVERVTKMVLDSLEDAQPFFDHNHNKKSEEKGKFPSDMQFHHIGDMYERLHQDLAAGEGNFPVVGTHGVEYLKERDNRDKKLMRFEQYVGKSGLEFASAQGKLSAKQTAKLEEKVIGVMKLKKDCNTPSKEPRNPCVQSLIDELYAVMTRSTEHDAYARCKALSDVLVGEVKLLNLEKRRSVMTRLVAHLM